MHSPKILVTGLAQEIKNMCYWKATLCAFKPHPAPKEITNLERQETVVQLLSLVLSWGPKRKDLLMAC